MKKIYSALILSAAFLMAGFYANAQFVKTYSANSPCIGTKGNLTFNCITKAVNGNFYIAGLQDTSLYISEVDALGNVVREKLIGVGSKTYNLRSMITDDDGNIVIVGDTKASSYPIVAFLMKISPALSVILDKQYDNLNNTNFSAVSLNDIKDYSSRNVYYLSGGTRKSDNSTAADALLMTVDRNTGNPVNIYSGSAGEDGYDAFVFKPNTVQGNPPGIIATGRLSHAGTITFRPWINVHNGGLAFTTGKHYLQPESKTARLYSSSFISDNQNVLYCWTGDLTGTGYGINTGLSSFNYSTLAPIWQYEYKFTPSAAAYVFLNKIATDANGYMAEGNWWDGASTANDGAIAGEMILLRTDKNGNAIWSRKMNKIFVNQRSHNSGFLIDGNFVYSVGFKFDGTYNNGVLVKIPLATGAMDTTCAAKQTTLIKKYTYSVKDSIKRLDLSFKTEMKYFPVNCTQTTAQQTCDSCKNCKFDNKINSVFEENNGRAIKPTGKIKVYPNPANNTITFKANENTVLNSILQITTLNGKTFYKVKLNSMQQNINVANWISGQYIYTLILNGKITDSGNFVIQH